MTPGSQRIRDARAALYYRKRIAQMLVGDALRARRLLAERPQDLSDLRAWCSFVATPASGHSLVGALLDAHPDVVMGSEYGALDHVIWGFRPRAIAAILSDHTQSLPFNRVRSGGARDKGRRFDVAGQWQGKVRHLRVLGDKNGSADTMRLDRRPWLLPKIERRFGVPARIVHVYRNPYDVATTMVRKARVRGFGPVSISAAIDLLEARTKVHRRLYDSLPPDRIHGLCHEAHVSDPHAVLGDLLRFLDLEPEPDFLDACAALCFPTPRKAFDPSQWQSNDLDRIRALVERTAFLERYRDEPLARSRPRACP